MINATCTSSFVNSSVLLDSMKGLCWTNCPSENEPMKVARFNEKMKGGDSAVVEGLTDRQFEHNGLTTTGCRLPVCQGKGSQQSASGRAK
ncbi:hypothetical protein PGT21_026023 [Puccinia graminis f. sp. tritici]|uniref:Uncharacterized protein n=1 Tax=Puccinia graminis f. sp. tritici TaxID=56615 RepID=A0A5B0RDP6_PUCGR|nr:hypothetical protein PGT21_026023 [Puccinia graminis f. sp. tritici]KAA1123941.1 hypothetical protein PGTUg99_006787 [Puccinia graminis f. sp. tritici]